MCPAAPTAQTGVYFDTAFFIAPDGETVGKYRKTHPAAVQTLETIYLCGGSRFPVAKVRGFAVGVVICCDHCFPEAVRCCAVNGAEMVFGGRSHIGFDPSGEILATASSESDDTIVAELSRVRVYPARRRWPMLRDRRPEVYGR